jgi:hypothetical protein
VSLATTTFAVFALIGVGTVVGFGLFLGLGMAQRVMASVWFKVAAFYTGFCVALAVSGLSVVYAFGLWRFVDPFCSKLFNAKVCRDWRF